jgi:CMP-N,N'-diacetyllegionaminic acid synthase
MRAIALVPARGGSKGIPRKNVIDFCGFPLLAWTVACATRCRKIEKTYVSTDDDEIAGVAIQYGAEVIRRPDEISGDTHTSESALIHACHFLKKNGGLPDAVVFLQATSPLRETSELDGAMDKFAGENLDSMFSGAEPEDFLLWSEEGKRLESLNYDYVTRKRRQDADHSKRVWVETGSFYITRTQFLLKSGNRLGGRIGIWPVSFWKAFEVDSMESLRICASLMHEYGLDRLAPGSPGK